MYGPSFGGPSADTHSHDRPDDATKPHDTMRYYGGPDMDPVSSSSRYPAFEPHPATPQPFPQHNAFRDPMDYSHYSIPATDRAYPSGVSDSARPIQEYKGEHQDSSAPSQSQSYANRGIGSRFDGEWTTYSGTAYQQNTYLQNSPTNVVPVRGQGPWVVESRHRSPESVTTHPILPPLPPALVPTAQMTFSHQSPTKSPTSHDHETESLYQPLPPSRQNWPTLPPIQPAYATSPPSHMQLHFTPHHQQQQQQRGQSPQDVHSYAGEVSPPSIPASLNSPSPVSGSSTWHLTPAIFSWLTAVLDPKRRSDKSKPTPHGQCELCDVVCQRSGTLQQHIICQHRQKIARQVLMSQPYNEVLAIAFTVAQLHSDYQTGALTSECVHFRNTLQTAPHGLSSIPIEQFPLLREKLYELSNTEKWKGATCEYCGLLVQRKATLTDHLATCPSNPNPKPGRRRQDFKYTQSPPTVE